MSKQLCPIRPDSRVGSNKPDRRWQRHHNFPHLTKVSLGAQQVMQCAWNPPGLTIFELHLLGLAAGSGVVTHQTGSMRLVRLFPDEGVAHVARRAGASVAG